MPQEQADRAAQTDERLAADLAGLPQAWAELSAADDGEELAMAFIRNAYGQGYIRALEDVAAGDVLS